MAKIERFEDIQSWRKSRELTKQIYEITSTGEFKRDFGLKDQLRRASVSILSNIAEGFERGGDQNFSNSLPLQKALAEKFERNSMSLLIKDTCHVPDLTR